MSDNQFDELPKAFVLFVVKLVKRLVILVALLSEVPTHPLALFGALLLTHKFGVLRPESGGEVFKPYIFSSFAYAIGLLRLIYFRTKLPKNTRFWTMVEAFAKANWPVLPGMVALLIWSDGFDWDSFMFTPAFLLGGLFVPMLSAAQIRKLNQGHTATAPHT